MAKTIKILVDQDGAVDIEAIGFRGKGCAEAVDKIAEAIGVTERRKLKPEYHATEACRVNVKGGV